MFLTFSDKKLICIYNIYYIIYRVYTIGIHCYTVTVCYALYTVRQPVYDLELFSYLNLDCTKCQTVQNLYERKQTSPDKESSTVLSNVF